MNLVKQFVLFSFVVVFHLQKTCLGSGSTCWPWMGALSDHEPHSTFAISLISIWPDLNQSQQRRVEQVQRVLGWGCLSISDLYSDPVICCSSIARALSSNPTSTTGWALLIPVLTPCHMLHSVLPYWFEVPVSLKVTKGTFSLSLLPCIEKHKQKYFVFINDTNLCRLCGSISTFIRDRDGPLPEDGYKKKMDACSILLQIILYVHYE